MQVLSAKRVLYCDFHEILQMKIEEEKGSILKHDFKIHNTVDVIFIYDGCTASTRQTHFYNNQEI